MFGSGRGDPWLDLQLAQDGQWLRAAHRDVRAREGRDERLPLPGVIDDGEQRARADTGEQHDQVERAGDQALGEGERLGVRFERDLAQRGSDERDGPRTWKREPPARASDGSRGAGPEGPGSLE